MCLTLASQAPLQAVQETNFQVFYKAVRAALICHDRRVSWKLSDVFLWQQFL